jgi:hypothetical protein
VLLLSRREGHGLGLDGGKVESRRPKAYSCRLQLVS